MRSKKVICAVLAAAVMTTMAFASCGDSSSTAETSSSKAASSSADSTTAVQTSEATAKDLNALAEKLKECITEGERTTLNQFTEDRIEKMIGVKKDLYNKAVCIVDASGGFANEIDCFEAKDESAAKEIETALKQRIEKQKDGFRDYVPAEMPKLENAVLVVDGQYVIMCISSNSDKAKEIIG